MSPPIHVPEDFIPTPRRRDREACDWCGAEAQACRSVEWLRGGRCCVRCTGNHDDEVSR